MEKPAYGRDWQLSVNWCRPSSGKEGATSHLWSVPCVCSCLIKSLVHELFLLCLRPGYATLTDLRLLWSLPLLAKRGLRLEAIGGSYLTRHAHATTLGCVTQGLVSSTALSDSSRPAVPCVRSLATLEPSWTTEHNAPLRSGNRRSSASKQRRSRRCLPAICRRRWRSQTGERWP